MSDEERRDLPTYTSKPSQKWISQNTSAKIEKEKNEKNEKNGKNGKNENIIFHIACEGRLHKRAQINNIIEANLEIDLYQFPKINDYRNWDNDKYYEQKTLDKNYLRDEPIRTKKNEDAYHQLSDDDKCYNYENEDYKYKYRKDCFNNRDYTERQYYNDGSCQYVSNYGKYAGREESQERGRRRETKRDNDKEKYRDRYKDRDKDRTRNREREINIEGNIERKRDRDKDREKEKDNDRYRYEKRETEKEKEKEREKERERYIDRGREQEKERYTDRERERDSIQTQQCKVEIEVETKSSHYSDTDESYMSDTFSENENNTSMNFSHRRVSVGDNMFLNVMKDSYKNREVEMENNEVFYSNMIERGKRSVEEEEEEEEEEERTEQEQEQEKENKIYVNDIKWFSKHMNKMNDSFYYKKKDRKDEKWRCSSDIDIDLEKRENDAYLVKYSYIRIS